MRRFSRAGIVQHVWFFKSFVASPARKVIAPKNGSCGGLAAEKGQNLHHVKLVKKMALSRRFWNLTPAKFSP